MLIRDGYILDDLSSGAAMMKKDIRVSDDGMIEEIGDSLRPDSAEQVLHADGKLILPGMVNAHYHSYSNILKGTSYGEPLEIWASDTVALGHALDADGMRLSAQLGIVEMLRAGVTSCLDHIPHLAFVNTIAEEYQKAGFRASVAPMIADISDDRILVDFGAPLGPNKTKEEHDGYLHTLRGRYDEWVGRWHSPKGTLQVICGINSPQRASDDALTLAKEIAEEYSLGVHAHLLETRWQAASARAVGEDPVEKMARHGLLTQKTGLAHGVWLTPEQLDRIAGAGSTIVMNPTSNLFIGSGKAAPLEMIRRGIPVALGTDGSNCATGQNMLEVARTALLMSRSGELNYETWLSPQQAWQMATTIGADACGWEDLGMIKKGARADLVLADISGAEYWPANHLLLQILLLVGRLDVTDVLIQGRYAMRDRRIVCLDEDALLRELRARSETLPPLFAAALRDSRDEKEAYKKAYARHYQMIKEM